MCNKNPNNYSLSLEIIYKNIKFSNLGNNKLAATVGQYLIIRTLSNKICPNRIDYKSLHSDCIRKILYNNYIQE